MSWVVTVNLGKVRLFLGLADGTSAIGCCYSESPQAIPLRTSTLASFSTPCCSCSQSTCAAPKAVIEAA